MSLNEKIGTDIAAAMKAKDAPRLSALRMAATGRKMRPYSTPGVGNRPARSYGYRCC